MDDSDDNASFGANIYATSYTQSDFVLDSILSAPEHKAPSVTFSDDVAFTKGATDDELLFNIPELDTQKFYNYDGFSIYTVVGPFVPNYIYATKHHWIYRYLSIAAIIPAVYTIASLVRYCINGLSGRNRLVDVKKLHKFFLFKPDNIVMNNLESTIQIGGFNQCRLMRQSNKHFPYIGPHRHEDDAIDAFLYSLKSHDETTYVELIFGTNTLFVYV